MRYSDMCKRNASDSVAATIAIVKQWDRHRPSGRVVERAAQIFRPVSMTWRRIDKFNSCSPTR